uniref:Uncharacterized protein n=1 Tax=Oryza sativa subsp. japonica TaxID=39947 RepID=Q69LP8_ORYSJ|nr:hypothetical protein [Oryza sativa Japonica Group]
MARRGLGGSGSSGVGWDQRGLGLAYPTMAAIEPGGLRWLRETTRAARKGAAEGLSVAGGGAEGRTAGGGALARRRAAADAERRGGDIKVLSS